MDIGRPSWKATWGATIENLNKGKDLLSPNNGAIKQRYQEKPKELTQLVAKFMASLLDEKQSAMDAQLVLDEIRKLFPVYGKDGQPMPLPASKFPTATYRSLLELISAKMMWQAGETWAVPGGNKEGSDKKPDYGVHGREESEEVGDHLIVQTAKDVSDLKTQIGKGISLKVSKYSGGLVRVVIHVSDSPVYQELKGLDHSGWQKLAQEQVTGMAATVTARMSMLVIIAGARAYQFTRKELGL